MMVCTSQQGDECRPYQERRMISLGLHVFSDMESPQTLKSHYNLHRISNIALSRTHQVGVSHFYHSPHIRLATMAPISFKPKLENPQPPTKYSIISYPAQGVLLVTLNRPKDLNCINGEFGQELEGIWNWLDQEPALTVGVITGTGRAFCAGADLKGMKEYMCSNHTKERVY